LEHEPAPTTGLSADSVAAKALTYEQVRDIERVSKARTTLRVYNVLIQMALEFNPMHVRAAAYEFAKWLDALDAAQNDGCPATSDSEHEPGEDGRCLWCHAHIDGSET
jgi:hypothetical protein